MDAAGKPLVLCHGTKANFTVFRTDDELGAHFGTPEQADAVLDYWRSKGRIDGCNLMPVFLSIQRPLRLIDVGSFRAIGISQQLLQLGILDGPVKDTASAKAAIQAAGFDGVVYANRREGAGDSFIAFRPEQVKSAIGNSGLFSGASQAIDDHALHLALKARAATQRSLDSWNGTTHVKARGAAVYP